MNTWNSPKAKVQLRLSIQRLRTLQQKKEAQAKASRRDIATLLERGKVETARIKVEGLINEDIHVELLELLELYCELLTSRFTILEQNTREPDPAISEGVCSIIYAAPRTELKELHILRDLLMHKYGREFTSGVMENRNNCVTDRALRKLVVNQPPTELVDGYLREIARGYGIAWGSDTTDENNAEKTEDKPDEGGDQISEEKDQADEKGGSLPSPPVSKVEKEDDFDTLAKRFADLKKR
ncbi:hypothetical protein NP233_g13082 [Leucocoprinus birnbaumii]|uniref:DUF292-domain-containing protein n=1 Tax=Leucocoprinus birnbaumii TaxID=56174 RepID=A0AAD5VDJ9_9AGAR|nr:hypothetical protein NP233_g13082 [Leucocoprinus birnbaumii]